MSFSWEYIVIILIELVCILLSIMIHEISHGFAAYLLGDPTAKNAGRLTLNPVKHLDPFGSVIMPLILALLNGPIFAYAKPVPFNPYYFKNRKAGELIVAFAGPASNVLQALLGAGICFLCQTASPAVYEWSASAWDALSWIYTFGWYYCYINLILLFFNIIPLPPLDGASIIEVFLTQRGMDIFNSIKRYSMFILLAILILLPIILGWSPLEWYFDHTAGAIIDVLIP